MYLVSGETDFKKVAIGTGINVAVSPLAGIIMGYSIDGFRDLTGLEDSERIPELVKKQKPSIKKSLAAILTAASIGLTAGIYSLTPDKSIGADNTPVIEQKIDDNRNYSHPF